MTRVIFDNFTNSITIQPHQAEVVKLNVAYPDAAWNQIVAGNDQASVKVSFLPASCARRFHFLMPDLRIGDTRLSG